MNTGKPLWLSEPEGDQTSVRFCCPHCFEWIRNNEFEQHLKAFHPELTKISTTGKVPVPHQPRK